MPGGKTKTLSLCEKVQLIEEYEKMKMSARQLAVMYGVGKTQVYETLKNKERILHELSKGTSGQRKRLSYYSSFDEINKVMWVWFMKRMAEGLPVSGPMIQAEALKVGESLGKTDFKASNGWLESFRSRHNIAYTETCVREKDVIVQIEEDLDRDRDRQPTMPKTTDGFSEEDIFIAAETSLCYRMLPGSSGGECWDRSKLGVLLCMNMKGAVLKPLVVGTIARPKSFGNMDSCLPVQWRPSSRACITNFVLEEWLRAFNETALLENRNVVLVLDISSCQPVVSLPNVKLIRCLQPLDRSVISYFKWLFRKSLLQTVLLKEKDSSVGQACKLTSVLETVTWIGRAASNIPCDLVRKSFIKSGFAIVDGPVIDDALEQSLCKEISDLCLRLDLNPNDVIQFDDNDEENDGTMMIDDEVLVKEEPGDVFEEEERVELHSYSEAIRALNNLEKFAASKCCPQLLNALQEAKEALSQSCLSSGAQLRILPQSVVSPFDL